jgi:serine/threonine protein kinase
MGVVYRAHDEALRRDVAVKVLPSSFATDPDRLRPSLDYKRMDHVNLAEQAFGDHRTKLH